jgi:hypothetical protein
MTTLNQASRIGRLPKWPRSAYSASAPVTHSTTAPRMMKVVPGLVEHEAQRMVRAEGRQDFGVAHDLRHAQHGHARQPHRVIGPKNLPMPPVPRFCTANRPNSTTSVSGITNCLNAGDTTSRPSTADSTEMAGVMTPSP